MLYKTLLVLTVYLTTYFFYKTVFCVSENQECNVGLFKQVFPVGIAEVIFFATFSKNDKKKQKESPHSFFNECELSIF